MTITNTNWSIMYKEITDIHSDNGNIQGHTSIPLHTYLHDSCRCNFTFICPFTSIVGNAQVHCGETDCLGATVDAPYSYQWILKC